METMKNLPDLSSKPGYAFSSRAWLWVVGLLLLGVVCCFESRRDSAVQAAGHWVIPASNIAQLTRLTADDRATSDFFGTAVAVGSDRLVIGASGDDYNVGQDRGSVYVYAQSGTSYVSQQKITPPGSQSNDQFGLAVALSSDTLVVGAPGRNSNRGIIFVYTRIGESFVFQQELTAADGAGGDFFGGKVAIDEDTIVIGAPGDDEGGNNNQGSAYVFKRTGVTWSQQQKLQASDGAANDNFGGAVGFTAGTILTGSVIVVGAHLDDVDGKDDQGSAYVFVPSGGTWMQQQKLTAEDGASGDKFGAAVDVSGNTIVAGASSDSVGLFGSVGSAYVFGRSGTSWNQQQKLTNSDPNPSDHFGAAVVLKNDTIVVGAGEDSGDAGSNQGSAFVFSRTAGVWSEQQRLTADDGAGTDFFGLAVALYNDTVVVGAPGDDTGSGSAYVFAPPPNNPPTISTLAIMRTAGLSGSPVAAIGTVSDAEDAENNLVITFNGGATATVNGVTVSNVAVDGTGAVTGMVAAACDATTASFTMRVTDTGGAFAQTVLNVQVNPNPLPTLSYPSPQTVGLSNSLNVAPSSGPGDNASIPDVAVQSVAPPMTGTVTVNSVGTVSITGAGPVGNHVITIRATDNCGAIRDASFTVNVTAACAALTITPASLPAGSAGQSYFQQLVASGPQPTTWSLASGALPSGMTLSAGGLLSGVPTAFGNFNFSVNVSDVNGCPGSRAYTLTINPPCPAITVNPASLPNGTVGMAYAQTLTANGGQAPYNFAVSAGALPNGVTLSAGGALTGAPAQAGTFNFTVRATDGAGCLGVRDYTVTVGGGNGLQFYPLPKPVRLLDTRPGQFGCDAPGVALAGGASRTQTIAGRTCDGILIPASARAITGNITTVQSGGGYLTLYPSNASQPLVANSNYNPNEILNNVFTVGLGAGDGAFKIFVTSNTHVVVDVTGYYAPPGAANSGGLYFHPLPKPIRLLETRAGFTGCDAPGAPITGGAGGIRSQQARVNCDNVTIPANAQAVVGNATSVNSSGAGSGYLTLWPGNASQPLVASSNFLPGQVLNAPFTVGLAASGEFNIFTTNTTDLVIDLLGYYSTDANDVNGAGLLFNPLPQPVRLLETRAGFTGCYLPGAPLTTASTRFQPARGACAGEMIASNALAIVGNATVVNANAGYLTFWPSGAAQPLVATSNFSAGQILNRHFTVGLGANGVFNIFASATTDLIIDVSGFFAP